MRQVSEILGDAIAAGVRTLRSLESLETELSRAATILSECLGAGGKILACGNGGSAADVADFTTEFACRFVGDRRPYPAMNLAQGGSLLTATGNDYGFDDIFARPVRAFGNAGDTLVVVSTSGKSKNIRRALEAVKASQLKSIALLGRDGGDCAGLADVDLIVPGSSTARIQEAHKFLLHVLCEIVEPTLAGN